MLEDQQAEADLKHQERLAKEAEEQKAIADRIEQQRLEFEREKLEN